MNPIAGDEKKNNEDITMFNQLSQAINNSKDSLETINQLCEWLKNSLDGFGCAYATVLSDSSLGLDWITWFPDYIHSEKVHETDFSHKILDYIHLSECTIFAATELKTFNQRSFDWIEQYQIQEAMTMPFIYDQDIKGIFLVYRQMNQPKFIQNELRVASEISKLISRILELQIKLETSEQKIIEQDQMLHASLSMTNSLNQEEVLNAILRNALQLLPEAYDAHIFFYENECLNFGAAMFQNGSSGKLWAEPRQNGLTYSVARSGKMIVVDNIRADPLFKNTPEDWHGSIIGIPLIDKDIVVGVLTLAKLTLQKFSQKEIAILKRLADQASRVIQNARVHTLISIQAFTDPLTNLPNRRSFEWEAEKIIDRAIRYKRVFSVAMLDLNGFKRINDSYGHAIGDDSLRIITHCMKNSIRKTDFLARYGGDEFIILFPETNRDLADQVTDKLRKRVSMCQIPISQQKIETLTISYGLATFPEDGKNIKNLIALADTRLYLIKQSQK